jgi:glycosyltransferase involved in cell wall biosynthesis
VYDVDPALGHESRVIAATAAPPTRPLSTAIAQATAVPNDETGGPSATHQPLPEGRAAQHFPRISVIIPALNEAANLPHVLPRLPEIVSEVILVDGRSADGTAEVAQRLLPTINVVHQGGMGKGDAIRAGCAACTGDVVVMLDADGSNDPGEIPRFVEALLAGADFAKGSRFIWPGGSLDLTRLRGMGNRCMNTFVNLLFRARFTDLCYGYNAFWKRCLNHFDVDCQGFEVETLINLRAHKAQLKIVEIPSFEHARIHGTSHLRTFRDGWRVLQTILAERANGRSVIRTARSRQRIRERRRSTHWAPQADARRIGATQ